MNQVQLFEPFSSEVLNDFFKGVIRPLQFEFANLAPSIRVEVSEKDDAYHVRAEVPGVRKEDIKVKIDGDRVSISAEAKKEESEKNHGKVIRSEFQYGVTSRTIGLGGDVDAAKATASYADGVLDLDLPKLPSAGARNLTIQ